MTSGSVDAVDLFAGAGGLSEGIRMVAPDLRVVGLEWDHAACRTRVANGHPTIRADIAAYPTAPFAGVHLVAGGPPCQTFSVQGSGDGRAHLDAIARAAGLVADGADPAEAVARVHDTALDVRSVLVLQPLRWVRELRPSYVLLEEVRPVLPIWQAIGDLLRRRLGYHVWTGTLRADAYGVPQARPRSLLLARLDSPVQPPPPTYRRYDARPASGQGTLDDGLLPCVTMYDAVGWGFTERPALTIVSRSHTNGKPGGGRRPMDGGSGARAAIARAREAGDWVERPGHTGKSVTMSAAEVGVLQSFDRAYCWCGTEAQRQQQAGNAVPPLLAAYAAAALLGVAPPPPPTYERDTR